MIFKFGINISCLMKLFTHTEKPKSDPAFQPFFESTVLLANELHFRAGQQGK